MMSENTQPNEEEVKTNEIVRKKNPKRVAAGKKAIEAKKMKAELRRKETENLKKENMKLKSITKETEEVEDIPKVNIYLPLCIIGVVGVGLYFYKSKPQQPIERPLEKEIDPFEFN